MRRFAKVLNEILSEREMTQNDLVNRTGFDHSKISRLINSVFRPSPEDLSTLFEAFDDAHDRYRLAHAHIADELPPSIIKQLDIEIASSQLREKPNYDLLPPHLRSALEHILRQYPENDAIADFLLAWARMLDWDGTTPKNQVSRSPGVKKDTVDKVMEIVQRPRPGAPSNRPKP